MKSRLSIVELDACNKTSKIPVVEYMVRLKKKKWVYLVHPVSVVPVIHVRLQY